MKKLLIICASVGAILGGFILASAANNCGQVFPTGLNNYVANCIVPSSWANALEAKIGIVGSTATSSLDYQINDIFTSYGSEQVASSAVPWINYGTASSPSSTWLKPGNNLSELTNTSTARSNLGLGDSATLPSSTWFKVANNLSEGNASTMRTNLGLGSIATHPTTDYLPSSTAYVSSINGSGSGAYSIIPGNNVSISTTTTSTLITLNVASTSNPLTTGNTPSLSGGISYVLSTTTQFSYTGNVASFTLPTNVTGTLTVYVAGPEGGITSGVASPGYGAAVTGTITYIQGETFWLSVGSSTGGGAGSCTGSGSTAGQGGAGSTGNTVAQPGWDVGNTTHNASSAPDIWSGAGSGNSNYGGYCGTAGASPTWISTTSTLSTSTALAIEGGGGAMGGGKSGSTNPGNGGNAATSTGASAASGTSGMLYSGGGGGGGQTFISTSLGATSTGLQSGLGTVIFSYGLFYKPTIIGNNFAGSISYVTSTQTSSTITFASPNDFVNGESCGVTPNDATNTAWISYNATTSFTVTFQNALTAGQSFNYWCLGF